MSNPKPRSRHDERSVIIGKVERKEDEKEKKTRQKSQGEDGLTLSVCACVRACVRVCVMAVPGACSPDVQLAFIN